MEDVLVSGKTRTSVRQMLKQIDFLAQNVKESRGGFGGGNEG